MGGYDKTAEVARILADRYKRCLRQKGKRSLKVDHSGEIIRCRCNRAIEAVEPGFDVSRIRSGNDLGGLAFISFVPWTNGDGCVRLPSRKARTYMRDGGLFRHALMDLGQQGQLAELDLAK